MVGINILKKKMGKVEKGVAIGIGEDTAGVPLVKVRIWERLISTKLCLEILVSKRSQAD